MVSAVGPWAISNLRGPWCRLPPLRCGRRPAGGRWPADPGILSSRAAARACRGAFRPRLRPSRSRTSLKRPACVVARPAATRQSERKNHPVVIRRVRRSLRTRATGPRSSSFPRERPTGRSAFEHRQSSGSWPARTEGSGLNLRSKRRASRPLTRSDPLAAIWPECTGCPLAALRLAVDGRSAFVSTDLGPAEHWSARIRSGVVWFEWPPGLLLLARHHS